MINGRPCGSKPPASENETQRAVAWMRSGLFGFVGDTEQWDRSVCVGTPLAHHEHIAVVVGCVPL